MAEDSKDRRSIVESVKVPLIFSCALGVVAGLVTLIVSSGGTDNPRVEHVSSGMDNPVNLALLAFGIAFIASLLIVSMLQLASRENPASLSEGSGVNRRSEEVYRQQVAARREKARQKEADEDRAQQPEDPDYGQRSE